MSPQGTALASFAALGSALCWAIASFLVERLLERKRELRAAAVNFFKNSLALLVFLALWLLSGAPFPAPAAFLGMLASGMLGFALSDSCFFAALSGCGVQAAAMVYTLTVPLTALLSFLFLGESLRPWTLTAMGIALAGILLTIAERRPASAAPSASFRRGIELAVLAALFQAVGVLVGHAALSEVGVLSGSAFRLAGGVGGALLLAGCQGFLKRSIAPVLAVVGPSAEPRQWPGLLPPAVCAALIGLPLYTLALRDAPGAISTLLFTSTPLFTLPILFALGRSPGWRSVVGTTVGFAGIAAVIASQSP